MNKNDRFFLAFMASWLGPIASIWIAEGIVKAPVALIFVVEGVAAFLIVWFGLRKEG